jgi:hypothetical protein
MHRLLFVLLLTIPAAFPAVSADGPRAFVDDPLVEIFSDPSRPGLFQAGVRWGEIQVRGHDSVEVRLEPRIEVEASLAGQFTDDEIRDRISIRLVERDNIMEAVIDSTLEGFYSVDLTLWVPRESSLGLEVRDGGNIEVHGVTGEVEVANRNGSVELSGLAGAAVVHARNGSIRASFDEVPAELPMSFSTLNGSVDVTFPEPPPAEVKIRYNRGGVESDFPIVSVAGDLSANTTGLDGRATRLLEGRIGVGGPRYYFHTANGTVYLRQARN